MSIFRFNVLSCVHYRLKFIILCLYDAGAIASAPKGPKDSARATDSVIAGILNLRRVQPDASSTKDQDEPSSDLLAYRQDGEQQPEHAQEEAVVATMAVPAQDRPESTPMQPSVTESSAPQQNETDL